MKKRSFAVGSALKKAIGGIISREMRDPRVGFPTVTRVEVSVDLKHARVYVSVLGGDREKNECLEALAHAGGYIKRKLSERVHLRYMPDLTFVLDPSIEYSIHLDEVFKKIEDEKERRD